MKRFYQPYTGPQISLALVELTGIEYVMEIGVAPKEQGRKQRVTLDVEVGYDDGKTRIPDSAEGLINGFDYSQVRNCIHEVVSMKANLIETVANRVADAILALPGALTCSVKVTKERVWSNVPGVSITIHRDAPRSR